MVSEHTFPSGMRTGTTLDSQNEMRDLDSPHGIVGM